MSSQPLIKPEQLESLPGISEENKRTWKSGLANLWNTYNNSPEGSPGKQEAKNKIATASSKIMQTISNRSKPGNAGVGAQRAPQPTQGGGQGGQPQAAQQAGQAPSGGQAAQNPPQQQMQQAQQGQSNNPQAQHAQAMQAMQNKVKAQVLKVQIFPSPTVTSNDQFSAHREAYQHRYGTALLRFERAQYDLNRLTAQLKQTQQRNPSEITEDQKRKYQLAKDAVNSGKEDVMKIEEENKNNKDAYNRRNGKAHDSQQNSQGVGSNQANGSQPLDNSRPSTQQGDVKMPSGISNSPQQPQGQFTQQQQQPQGASTPVQHSTPQQMQQHSQPSAQSQNQATPHSATQPQAPHQNFLQNNMGQQIPPQPQQRPPMNQQQPSQQQQYQQQQQQYPIAAQANMPQNGMSNAQNQGPRALTQQAAMAQAAQTYTQNSQQPPTTQPQPQMQQPHANMPNGLPFSNTPHSATQQHTPTGATGFPTGNGQISSSQTKFAIPKELKLDPRTQMPVQGPPARPTFQTGNMMNTPGVQKPPPFTLEGEGDHVLSKRKLDELVRQITGSTSPSDNLSPEVEEAVLALTDNFVDNVVQKACQLAKLRQGQTLDVRDIQMVLERNYGIRIPGFSLDEVRTVRKFQPAPGWVGKVQAVQAGKVMGGGKDA